ncbi:FHA domain-containing protein [Prosthecobacter fusiformis]|uniref:FHA domain-containing protein n=1 Tax=Prosthecobacter fusiformis TaxID=48464 RepID=A0A4R7RL75_9BACT|nr:FHA domain-containing protein [Prosthecobacter fusiformis]TDU66054.1 FHA domain-containing protein [Prosthecobacter fusiformis]
MATLIFYLEDGTTLNHTLDEGTTTIGRHPDSVVVLEFSSVSGHHAVIELSDNGCFISDLKSSNGTRVNGVEIEEAQLQDGDRIGFGDVQAVFAAGEAPAIAYVPQPEVKAAEPPPPVMKANYRPAPPKRNPQVKRSGYPQSEGGGCGTAIVVIGLFIAALLAGLYMRHHKETEGGNFFEDVAGKLGTKIPKIKIEKKIEE